MALLRLVLAVMVMIGVSGLSASAEPRVALVIGNSDYGAEMGALPNPANDAALMAKALRNVGFDVIEITDATQKKMKRAIVDFGQKLTDAGPGATGLFFYAGHGIQVGGENYLIPLKAQIKREGDVEVEAVPANMVLKQMDFSGSQVSIVILDACRNNPMARSLRSATRGLAEIGNRPTGSFIAYSTAPGQTAADGTGQNSPYSSALAEAIQTPGLGIEEVFRTVRGKVIAATDQQQVPWDASSLTAPFYFLPPVAPVAAVDNKELEITFWNSIKDSRNPEDFTAYLEQYPKGAYVKLARNRIKSLEPSPDAGTAAPAPPAAAPLASTPPPPAATPLASAPPPEPKVYSTASGDAEAERSTQEASVAPDIGADLKICQAQDEMDEVRLRACKRAVESGKLDDEKRHVALNELGRAHYNLGNLDEALVQYQAAIKVDPQDAAPYYNIGLINADREAFAEALRFFDKAADLDPQDPDAIYKRSTASAALGDFDAARRDLDRAIEIDNKSIDYLDQRAYLNLAQGKLTEAEADVASATKSDGEYWSLTAVLVHYLAGKTDAAGAMADRVLKGEADYPYATIWKALVLKAQGKTAAADKRLADGRKQFAKSPWPTPLFDYLNGRISDEKLLAAARSSDPKTERERLCEYYFYTGETAYQAGDRARAAQRLQQAVDTKVYHYLEYAAAQARLRELAR